MTVSEGNKFIAFSEDIDPVFIMPHKRNPSELFLLKGLPTEEDIKNETIEETPQACIMNLFMDSNAVLGLRRRKFQSDMDFYPPGGEVQIVQFTNVLEHKQALRFCLHLFRMEKCNQNHF